MGEASSIAQRVWALQPYIDFLLSATLLQKEQGSKLFGAKLRGICSTTDTSWQNKKYGLQRRKGA